MTTRKISEAVRRRVIERQGGRCAGRGDGWEGCGKDLRALLEMPLAWLLKAVPKSYLINRGRAVRRPVEIDHIVPRAQGGSDEPANLQALCAWCHHAKTAAERQDWEAPTHSATRDLIRGPSQKEKLMAGGSKTVRLRQKMPVKRYEAG